MPRRKALKMINGISGHIDPNVLINKANQRFNSIDTDQDGILSPSELNDAFSEQGFSQARIDHFMDRFDVDGDGAISQKEHDQVIQASVQRILDNQSGGSGNRPAPVDPARGLVEVHSTITKGSVGSDTSAGKIKGGK